MTEALIGDQVVGVDPPLVVNPAELIPARGSLIDIAERVIKLAKQCAVERIVGHHHDRSRTVVGHQLDKRLASARSQRREWLDAGSAIQTAVFALDFVPQAAGHRPIVAIVESDIDGYRRAAGRTDCLRGGDRSV